MSFIYQFDQWRIDPQEYTIHHGDAQVKLRQKTFSLLILFLESPQSLLSKQQMLDKVWQDTKVDEQVLFQSIREIRQIFNGLEVIKTLPREGYSWIIPVEKKEKAALKNTNQTNKRRAIFALLPFSLVVMAFLSWLLLKTENNIQGAIVILPFSSSIADNNHAWVKYGAMDQLISGLTSNAQFSVLPIDHVIKLMRRAEISNTISSKSIHRLFEVSGAAMIVEASLSGFKPAYQVKYQLHFANDTKKGVYFAESVNQLLDQMKTLITTASGAESRHLRINSEQEFQNELMYQAMENLKGDNPQLAIQLFKGIVEIQPQHLIAYRLLAEALIAQNEFAQAAVYLNQAIALAEADNIELHRLTYFLAQLYFDQGDLDAAQQKLASVIELAPVHFDWLYLGYAQALKGEIAQSAGEYQSAQKSLELSLKYQSQIQCPVGMSLAYLRLAENAALLSDQHQKIHYFGEAKSLIEEHHLSNLLAALGKYQAQLNMP